MSVEIFDKKYKAVSNFFLSDIEGNHYVFPYPLSLRVTMKNEDIDKDYNKFEVIVPSYFDSILTVDYYVDIFFYALSHEYKLQTFLFKQLGPKEQSTDIRGYRAVYMFDPTQVVNNICALENEKVYKIYKQFENEEA